MKGNKFLAAVLAASMAFSMVPATTLSVFAESSISVDASEAALSTHVTGYTVNGEAAASGSIEEAIGDALKTADIDGAATSQAVKDTFQGALNTAATTYNSTHHTSCVWNVESTTITSSDLNGTVVVSDQDGKTYNVEFTTYTAITASNDATKDEAAALEGLFDGITAITYDGNSISTAVVQAALNSALNTEQNKTNATDATTFWGKAAAGGTPAAGAGHGYKYTVQTAAVSGDTVSGRITRTVGSATYYYDYTAAAKQNSESQRDLIADAIKVAQESSYPTAVDADKNDSAAAADYADVIKKIQDTINGELDGNASATVTFSAADPAKHNYEGTLNTNISGRLVSFTLTHSSAQKMKESEDAIEKTALKGTSDVTLTGIDTASDGEDTDGDGDDDANTSAKLFASTTSFARSIQSRTATVAVDAETVRAAVEKAVTDATSKLTDDGVTYKVESVKDKQTKAKVGSEGDYLVKVTASTANDLYGIKSGAKDTLNDYYYVEVKTPALKENATTGISLADKTIVLKPTYYSTEAKVDAKTPDVDIVEITPTVTPEDSNSILKWSITKKTGDANGFATSDVNNDNTANDIYDADKKAVTFTDKDGKFCITAAGTYEISVQKANDAGVTAKMTLTVRDTFKDVPKTAYYNDAVEWAYGKDVTNGVSDDTFGVNEDVTRAQYVTWLYRYAVSKDSSVAIDDDDVTSTFSDVAADKYYAKAVQWAVANGVTDGTSTTTFSPDQKISRAQAITMLWRMNGKPYAGHGSQDESVVKFTDVPSNAYYTTAVTWAVQTYRDITATTPTVESVPITSGTSTTTFSPDADCTRAQAITFIYRAYA